MTTVPVEAALGARLVDEVRARCIVWSRPDRPLVDSRGRPQVWLFDLRPFLMNGETALALAGLFWDWAEPFWPFQLAAQELAGVPLMGALLSEGARRGHAVTGVIVRRERKTHGRQRRVEGDLSDLPVMLVDDIVNSGGSAVRAAEAVREEGGRPVRLFTVVDFGAAGLADRMREAELEAASVFRLDQFGIDFPAPPPPRASDPLEIVWRFRPKRASYLHVARKAAPAVAGDRVVHASEDGWVHALRIGTGEPIWAFQAARRPGKGTWSTPLVADGAVYVGSYDGAVHRLDLETGEARWRFDGADWVGSSAVLGARGRSIFIGLEHALGGGTGGVARLDVEMGAIVWEHRTPAQVHATPLVLPRGAVVCGANDGRVRLLDPDTGRAVWTTSVESDVKAAPTLSADGERIYVGSCDGGVWALDRRTGRVLWRGETEGPVFGAPLEVEGAVAASSLEGSVRLFAGDDGRELARMRLGGKLFAAPVRVEGALVVGSTDGRLSRLRLPDLAVVAQHQFPERITSEVAAGPDGLLFCPTYDGQLFAVRDGAAEADAPPPPHG